MCVSLNGPFRIWSEARGDIKITGVMVRRLIAILLLSKNMRRSRNALREMLWDAYRPDPAANLRQLLRSAKDQLGAFSAHLATDGDVVQLVSVVDRTERTAGLQEEFFEDAGIGTEDFEDWYRLERQRFEDLPLHPPTFERLRHMRPRPKVILTQAGSEAASVTGRRLAAWATDHIRDVLVHNAVFDVRDSARDPAPDDIDMELRLAVHETAGAFDLSVGAYFEGSCHLSQSKTLGSHSDIATQREDVLEFAHRVVSLVERTVMRLSADRPGRTGASVFMDAVTLLFSMRPGDIAPAVRHFRSLDAGEFQAQSYVWRAFAAMLEGFEFGMRPPGSALEEATGLLESALALSPTDPAALSVSAYRFGVGERDLKRARQFSDEALELAPFSPFARYIRAGIAIREGETGVARRHARTATKMGRFGPMRLYLAGAEAILATVAGDHAEAVQSGSALLHLRPHYLPVLEHIIASLLETGAVDEAHRLYCQIQDTLNASGGKNGRAAHVVSMMTLTPSVADILSRHNFPDPLRLRDARAISRD